MLDDLKKIPKKRFKRTNFKAFSFFLGFSLVIWFLVQFSKTYEETIQVPIALIEVPKDKIITDSEAFLDIRYRDNGFRISWFSLFKKDLRINLSQLKENQGKLVYHVEDHSSNIFKQLDLPPEKVTFLEKSLKFDYQQKTVKVVPVISKLEVRFKPGYASYDSVTISPSSIKISGPKNRINAIEAVYTLPLNFKKVDHTLSGEIAIDTKKLNDISLYTSRVDYLLEVEKFTEGTVQIPIKIINAPRNMNFVLFPSSAQVVFKVSLQNYDQITQSDFKIVCDYNELEDGQQFFIPKIVDSPNEITHMRLGVNKVKFIIKE